MTVLFDAPNGSRRDLAAHLDRILALADVVESGQQLPTSPVAPVAAPFPEVEAFETRPSVVTTARELGAVFFRSVGAAFAASAVVVLVGAGAVRAMPEPPGPSVHAPASIPEAPAPAP